MCDVHVSPKWENKWEMHKSTCTQAGRFLRAAPKAELVFAKKDLEHTNSPELQKSTQIVRKPA
jgi:hypothetical protein